jgi:hypothetical protein
MPVLPAFWKHYFGHEDSTGYDRYGHSKSRAIEMLNSARSGKPSGNSTLQKNHAFGSDENVLINDALGPPMKPSKTKLSAQTHRTSVVNDTERFPAPALHAYAEEEELIMKTVEIRQTYE